MKMPQGFRQRIRHLRKKLHKCEWEESIEASDHRDEMIRQLQSLQAQRRSLRRCRLTRKHSWNGRATSKFFYRRICTKFEDNVIHCLNQGNGGKQRNAVDKANILADAWFPIINSTDIDHGSIDKYVERLKCSWAKHDLEDMDNSITEAEVEAAINKCKRGKAAGPDKLGNDWYKDHTKDLNLF